MKKNIFILLCLLCGLPLSIFAQQTVQLTVEVGNQWKTDKTDAPVVIRLNEVNPGFRVRSAVVMNGNEEIASQLDDLDGDLKADELAFVINVPAQSIDRYPFF